MWVLEVEVIAWDGSIIQLQRVLDPKPEEEPYIILSGLKTAEKKVFRRWGEASNWEDALNKLTDAIQKNIQSSLEV